ASSYAYFFSSRRRHTRWPRDWSSDVCSSDLPEEVMGELRREIESTEPALRVEFIGILSDLIGDLASSPSPVEIRLYSEDTKALRSEEHTSELQSRGHLVCRLLLEKKK